MVKVQKEWKSECLNEHHLMFKHSIIERKSMVHEIESRKI